VGRQRRELLYLAKVSQCKKKPTAAPTKIGNAGCPFARPAKNGPL